MACIFTLNLTCNTYHTLKSYLLQTWLCQTSLKCYNPTKSNHLKRCFIPPENHPRKINEGDGWCRDKLGRNDPILWAVNHLFLHYPTAAGIWNFFLSLFGLTWSMPQSIKETYTGWIFWRVYKPIKKVLETIPAVILWVVWNERNPRCFDGISTPAHSLKARCLVSLYTWNFLNPDGIDSYLYFVSSMVLV